MKRYLLVLFCLIVIVACNKAKENVSDADSTVVPRDTIKVNQIANDSTYERFRDFRNYLVKGEVSETEIQEIDFVSALVVSPTDEQIKAMIEENGEEDFSTIADDASFYQSEGTIALDSFGIKTIDAEKRYIRFVGESESWLLDIRQIDAPAWNIIFFDPKKKPQINNWVDINFDELIAYYGIK